MKLKAFYLVGLMAIFSATAFAQDPPQDWWEEWQPANDVVPDDDARWVELDALRRQPISINQADAEDLQRIPFLSALHISQLILYRTRMGPLLHFHELQAIPGWTAELIRKLLPYIVIEETWKMKLTRENWLKKGVHSLLSRWTRKWSNENESDKPVSPDRLFVRYRYQYLNRIQWGVVADKDAGEPLFGPVQKAGFDFYSAHFFVRLPGKLKALAVGDFTVNMGQGLIHWQRMGFGKAGDLAAIKQQAPSLAPYHSAGEYAFHRGLGWQLQFGRLNWTGFVSKRKLSATPVKNDQGKPIAVSAIRISGLHTTPGEQEGRNLLGQFTTGSVLRYQATSFLLSVNFIYHRFDLPVWPAMRPDNLFAVSGNDWWNASVDYSYTWKNLHFFGEMAVAPNGSFANTHALLASVSPQLDLALHVRDFSIRYRAVQAQTFSERTSPGNERGFFLSVDLRPGPGWKLRAYADHYLIPWITATRDYPYRGGDYWWQLSYQVRKSWDLSLRWRNGWQQAFESFGHSVRSRRQGWRAQLQIRMNGNVEMRHRMESIRLQAVNGSMEHGMNWYSEFIYRPQLWPWQLSARVQYFQTDSYQSRVYAYERDVLYYSTIPAFYGSGWRFYLLWKMDWGKRFQYWFRLAKTMPVDRSQVAEQLMQGSLEARLQVMYVF